MKYIHFLDISCEHIQLEINSQRELRKHCKQGSKTAGYTERKYQGICRQG